MNSKKKIAVLAVLLCVVCTSPIETYATTKYGFTYDSHYKVSWRELKTFNVYTQAKGKLGTCGYVVGVGRQKKTNNYILMTKEVMTPNKRKAKIRGLNYGYGFSEYVSVKATLPTLDDYKPQNEPSKDTLSFSIGADKSGANISASYSITHSDLDITSSCNTPNKLFYIKYNYKPSIANPCASNKYVANESIQLGAASFHTSNKKVSVTVNYDARFGVAENSNCSPWLICLNYIYKETDSETYNFTIKK